MEWIRRVVGFSIFVLAPLFLLVAAFYVRAQTSAPSPACDQNAVGDNQLVGCLWDGINFDKLIAEAPAGFAVTPPISDDAVLLDFDWGRGRPHLSIAPNTFSIRWRGRFVFSPGVYTFTAASDDAIRVRLNGLTKVDHWRPRRYSEDTFTESYSAEKIVHIVIDYYEGFGQARINFRWQRTEAPDVSPRPSPKASPVIKISPPPSAAVPAEADAFFRQNLSRGSVDSAEVLKLQNFLAGQGFFAGPSSGNFFTLTEEAVRKFQAAYGLPATGYFGPLTREKANGILTGLSAQAGRLAPQPAAVSPPSSREELQERIRELQSQLEELVRLRAEEEEAVYESPSPEPSPTPYSPPE